MRYAGGCALRPPARLYARVMSLIRSASLRHVCAFFLVAAAACVHNGGTRDGGTRDTVDDRPVLGDPPLGLDVLVLIPAENPVTAAKVTLGRQLFFDPLLSADGTISCAACHRPERAFADDVPFSPGVHGRVGTRNAPSIVNTAYSRHFLWDGRSTTLEEQVLLPIENELEMGTTIDEVLSRLRRSRAYRARFDVAFGGGPTAERLSHALASFVRTLRFADSPADRFRAGEEGALPAQARRGFMLFVGKARCATCHVGAMLSDQRFHNTGVAWRDGRLGDAGRAVVTGAREDSGAFKTPSLRNVALTSPYMHDGSIPTLEGVVEFYDRGGVQNPFLSADISALRLTGEERADLIAFLRSLTSPLWEEYAGNLP